jgi:hypothetical protein
MHINGCLKNAVVVQKKQVAFVEKGTQPHIRANPITRLIFAGGTPMDTGSSNNRRGVRGMSGAYGGEEPQPQDAQVGGWSRAQREQMDEKFRQAFERALRQEGGDERR